MKIHIKITGLDGKSIEGDKKLRDENHLKALSLYPSRTYRDRTKYNRKKKHKGVEVYE